MTAPPAARLALPAVDGSIVDLGAYRGRVVLVHFFATWCEPCRTELPALERLAAAARADVTVLAISVAEPDVRVRRYFAAFPVGFPVLLDRDRTATRDWDVLALPTTFLLDRSLRPLSRADGDVDWDGFAARQAIAAAIAAPASPNTD